MQWVRLWGKKGEADPEWRGRATWQGMVPRMGVPAPACLALTFRILQYLLFVLVFSQVTHTHTHTHSQQENVSSSILSTCLKDVPFENWDFSEFVSCPPVWSSCFSFGSLLYSCLLRQAWRAKEVCFVLFVALGLWLALTPLCLLPFVKNMK